MTDEKAERDFRGTHSASASQAESLIASHLSLVHSIARRLKRRLPPNVTYEDLVSVGSIGLVQAAHRFESARNLKFGTFARHRVLGSMIDSLRAEDLLSRQARQASRESATRADAWRPLPTTVSFESVSATLLRRYQSADQASQAIALVDLQTARRRLCARENRIISLLYERGWSNREGARELRVNESRVSQLKSAALAKLRHALTTPGVTPQP